MKYYLYILLTVKNTFYCGIARNPLARFELHQKGKGAKYTRANKPLKIVYLREFEDKNSALCEEYRIKKTLNRKQKSDLVQKNETQTRALLKNLSCDFFDD